MTSKRRRTKQQIQDDKAAAQAKQAALEEKLGLIDRLQQELAEVQAQQQVDLNAKKVLGQMLDAGFLVKTRTVSISLGPTLRAPRTERVMPVL